MSRSRIARREFLKSLVPAAAAVKTASARTFFSGASGPDYDAKGLPTATLGKTGVKVPRIGIGLGSRFCACSPHEHASLLLSRKGD